MYNASRRFKLRFIFVSRCDGGSSLVRSRRLIGSMRESVGSIIKLEWLKQEVGVRVTYYNRKQNWKKV